MRGVPVATDVGGVPVLVETVAVPGTEPTAGRRGDPEQVRQMFARAQAVIEQMAVSAVELGERIAARARKPDQLEVQFGLKFSASGHVVLASAATEASLNVKIVYDGALADGDRESGTRPARNSDQAVG